MKLDDNVYKEIDSLKIEIGNLKNNFNANRQKISGLKKIVNNIEQIIHIDVNKSEANVILEFDNIDEFINSDSVTSKISPYFFCRAIAWYIQIKKKESAGSKYMAVYLSYSKPENILDQVIDTTYKVILLDIFNGEKKQLESTQEFKTEKKVGYGFYQFITLNYLQSGNYIQNNRIRIKVEFKINKMICQTSNLV